MIRFRREQARDLLLLDAGNAFYSGAREDLNQLSQGRITVAAMNLMGYDMMALGAYDLALDPGVLADRLAEAEFAVISSNVFVNGKLLLAPYAIVERAGRRIAVIGLTGAPRDAVAGVEVRDPVAAIKGALSQIGADADLVVVLSNLGPTAEAELAQQVAGIDLIVGGGSGIPQREVSWQGRTAVVRAGGLGEYLGVTEVVATGVTFQSVALGADFVDDPEMAALRRRYEEEYSPASRVTPG
ncbi:MAG: hypothetical protein GXX93_04985 [Anaerolineae bacterium]|nr:hypothetical protein [Anaerolineae bacterium]